MKNRRKREKFIYSRVFLTCTNFILYVLIYPTIQVFRMSMFKWGGFSNNQQFVGLENFKILWADENFFRTIQNTILLIVVVTLFTVVLRFFRSNPINRKDSVEQLLQNYFLYPKYFINRKVIAGVFAAVYDPKAGLLNAVLPEAWNKIWLVIKVSSFTHLAEAAHKNEGWHKPWPKVTVGV